MKTNLKMTCPQCKNEIDVDTILINQFRLEVVKDMEKLQFRKEKELAKEKEAFTKLVEKLNQDKERLDELVLDKVKLLIPVQEKELSEKLEQKIREENLLKMREKEKVIADMTAKINELKQKAEQGSMQLQGEVQELELVDILKSFHPTDHINRSKTGSNAADVLQLIRTKNDLEVGSIYYESKRTKTWSNDWIKKFKMDNLNTKADVLVLVTSALPRGIKRYGLIDGIWVCSIHDVGELSLVLRYGILKVQSILVKQKNKESKADVLFNYLSSDEFRQTFDSILSNFRELQNSFDKEKTSTLKYWKQREAVLNQILSDCVTFSSAVNNTLGTNAIEIKPADYRIAG
ncbi:MAG: DUF2130 domain-containing protein [Bacteroidia bacterium]